MAPSNPIIYRVRSARLPEFRRIGLTFRNDRDTVVADADLTDAQRATLLGSRRWELTVVTEPGAPAPTAPPAPAVQPSTPPPPGRRGGGRR